jgi:hypothetical protein
VAAGADVFPVELIGKDLLFFSAVGALANKGLQALEILKTGAMHGGCHGSLLEKKR